MVCKYHGSAEYACAPYDDGHAIFALEMVASDETGQTEMKVGERVPVCFMHLLQFSLEVWEVMRGASQLEMERRERYVTYLRGQLGLTTLDRPEE